MTGNDLKRILKKINGRGYKAYKDIEGLYDFGTFRLSIDHAQGDPFASPSRVRVLIPVRETGFPPDLFSRKPREVAFRDFLSRAFEGAIRRYSKGRRGTGRSGLIDIDTGGQEILERTSVILKDGWLEVRFFVGLPAHGRTILGHEAQEMFFGEIPRIVRESLFWASVDKVALRRHVEVCEDQEALREMLEELGLVAFVAEGAILPRRSGVDDRPLKEGVVPVEVPFELEVTVELPNRGRIRGMGIPKGVTLIVGGGFHGKSTLLHALERGIYNHIPGDGREYVVSDQGAVKIRAEDGRYIEQVDISPFISNLPFGKDTRKFSTENASGSTSQAANIMEALEVGARVLLMDEDTSATNFMVRDERMQALVAKEKEPITPFVDKVKKLHRQFGVSTVLVMGGSGDYFDVADTVIMMDSYRPRCVTQRAKEISKVYASRRRDEGGENFGTITPRAPKPESFDPSRGKRDVKIDIKGLKAILFGTTLIDLSALEQLVDESQTRAIGAMIHRYAQRYADGKRSLKEGLELLMAEVREKGLDCLVPYKPPNFAMPRIFEVAGAINRMRTLKVRQLSP
ncbi:MAG: ATPase [Deltaproteobacteria bacterium]|nr:MAG: ATPase [Deltaproteobacteria bacterium]